MKTINLVLLLQLGGVLHLGLICAGALMPRAVDLKKHLAALPPFIRRLFWVYYSFIGLCLVSFGLITFIFAGTLAAGGGLARALCTFLALFWTIRLIAAAFVFDVRPYGPRALGHRSILADPRLRGARERVNIRIKHREPFRPFAGIVPLEYAGDWFQLKAASPYMQFVVPLRAETKTRLAALDHFGTCRVQTVTPEPNPLSDNRGMNQRGDKMATNPAIRDVYVSANGYHAFTSVLVQ